MKEKKNKNGKNTVSEWVSVCERISKNEILTDLTLAKRRQQSDEIFWNFISNYSRAEADKFKAKAAATSAAAINGSKSRFFLLFYFFSFFALRFEPENKREQKKNG